MSKVMLVILDGRGKATDKKVSAIDQWNTPFVSSLYETYPHSELEASELAVGLPKGQVGNSEVWHTTLGAGRVLYQDIVKINLAIETKEFFEHQKLKIAFEYSKSQNKKVHIIGLLSDGWVHSHIDHFKALADTAKKFSCDQTFFHLFSDGRDTDPKSGVQFIKNLDSHLQNSTGKIASIIGRYYAMDRDNRRERVQKAYDLLIKWDWEKVDDISSALELVGKNYQEWTTDEFLPPILIDSAGKIETGDVVIFANFRSDRGRELTQALTQSPTPKMLESWFDANVMKKLDLHYITMTRYDEEFSGVEVLFEKDNVAQSLGEILEKAGKKQVRIAETEKYPHVTFFFSGGREEPFQWESRILIPSPKVTTYDLQPSMGTREIADAIIPVLENQEADFICLNFAAPDMVGHTGVREAAIEACKVVDESVAKILPIAQKANYTTIIIADHWNSDAMLHPDGSVHTAHTLAKVPCILVSPQSLEKKLSDWSLADIAPTILDLMNIEKPVEMWWKSLLLSS